MGKGNLAGLSTTERRYVSAISEYSSAALRVQRDKLVAKAARSKEERALLAAVRHLIATRDAHDASLFKIHELVKGSDVVAVVFERDAARAEEAFLKALPPKDILGTRVRSSGKSGVGAKVGIVYSPEQFAYTSKMWK